MSAGGRPKSEKTRHTLQFGGLGNHEVVQGAGVIQVVHGIPNEHLVVDLLGNVPADQPLGITELVLQQKNEGIQILAGVTVDIEDGATLTGGIFHGPEAVLLLSDQGNHLAEAVLGDLNGLLGRCVALPLFLPVLAVLHQEVVEVAGIGSIELLLSQVEFLVVGLIQPPVQKLIGIPEGFLEYKADGIVEEAFRADEQQVGANGVCQIHHAAELGIVFGDEIHCDDEGISFDHMDIILSWKSEKGGGGRCQLYPG